MPVCANSVSFDLHDGAGARNFVIVVGVPPCAETDGVVFTQAELDALYGNQLTNLTPAAGAEIATAILGVWALGYCYRVLLRFLRKADAPTDACE